MHVYYWKLNFIRPCQWKSNMREYYQQFEAQQNQILIDQRIKEHLGFHPSGAPYNPMMRPPFATSYMPMQGNTQLSINPTFAPGIRPTVLSRPPPGKTCCIHYIHAHTHTCICICICMSMYVYLFDYFLLNGHLLSWVVPNLCEVLLLSDIMPGYNCQGRLDFFLHMGLNVQLYICFQKPILLCTFLKKFIAYRLEHFQLSKVPIYVHYNPQTFVVLLLRIPISL